MAQHLLPYPDSCSDHSFELLHISSCQDGRDDVICEIDEVVNVTTRFYDIEIVATDSAGNVGVETCSVIVVPDDHYEDTIELTSSSKKSGKASSKASTRKLKGILSKSSKTSKSKKSSKQNGKMVEEPHNPDDLRLEYPLSIQRYELASFSLLWDNSRDTTLKVPPLPECDLDLHTGSGKGKGGGSKSSKGGGGGAIKLAPWCDPDLHTGSGKGKGGGSKSSKGLGGGASKSSKSRGRD
jgi:hypothetical protein